MYRLGVFKLFECHQVNMIISFLKYKVAICFHVRTHLFCLKYLNRSISSIIQEICLKLYNSFLYCQCEAKTIELAAFFQLTVNARCINLMKNVSAIHLNSILMIVFGAFLQYILWSIWISNQSLESWIKSNNFRFHNCVIYSVKHSITILS